MNEKFWTFTCNKCLVTQVADKETGYFYSTRKMFSFCKPCMDKLIAINPKNGEGYINHKPSPDLDEDCGCCCGPCECECHS
jgi:hypothetical protein